MKWLGLGVLSIILIGSTGCEIVAMGTAFGIGGGATSGQVQANTRAPEELYLGEGEGPSLYRYAEDLLYQGRYREAVNAYYNCEMVAYTNAIREAARTRRMWVQELIAAYADGRTPPPAPAITLTERGASQVPPKAIYDVDDTSGHAAIFHRQTDMSVFSANPRQLSPHQHYMGDGAMYHIYGYRDYPGDMKPEEVTIPPQPPYVEK